MPEGGIGARVLRKEDERFLTGRGRYVDDIVLPHQSYAWIVRSPHAHATIRGIDSKVAAAAPGVLAILTGADFKGFGGLPCGWLVTGKGGVPMKEPRYPVVAEGKVRYAGEAVAAIVAETRDQARAAAELVAVDYAELPAAIETAKADANGAPQLFDDVPNNICFDWDLGDKQAVDDAFTKAAKVVKIDLVNQRLVANAMEPRAANCAYDPGTGEHTLYTTNQNPHVIRLLVAAFVLQMPETKLRVVAPDVGGGFGSKIPPYAEEVIVTVASRKVGRPVKWTAERSEGFLTDRQGRDHVSHAELALDKDGKFLALRISTVANLGAYLSAFGPAVPTYLYAPLLAGLYTTPAIWCEVKGVFTNTAPVDAYRGAGRPEACYLLERLVNVAAAETGVDQAEIRRRNFIAPAAMPYQTPVASNYDLGDFARHMEAALKVVDHAGFEARRAASAKVGKLRGLGVASYIEACGIAPSAIAGALGARAGLYEAAAVRFNPTGTVTVLTGCHSHGQGHETTYAQLVADRLGVPTDSVEVVHGDTGRIPFGMGTYGSRSLAVGGSALDRAMGKVIDKGKKIAAHLLEASVDDIEFKAGKFSVAGTDKEVTIGQVAFAAYVPHNYPLTELEPGLDETAYYDPLNFTFPNGTHICELEIDRETGAVMVERFLAVDDFGRVVNPMIVEGQVHGGVVQGMGQALTEQCVYDSTGQLLTGSYNDYCLPRADDAPSFEVTMSEDVPCTTNPLGVKGCGEAGTIGASAAVMNAVVDALAPLGITHIDMPATPMNVWRAILAAGK